MSERAFRSGITRRGFLLGAAAGLFAGGVAAWEGRRFYDRLRAHSGQWTEPFVRKQFLGRCIEDPKPAFPLPGRYPGKVVEIHHPGSVRDGSIERGPVRDMIARGMMELTRAPDPTAAWQSMFQRGDRVGIKVNPVGQSRKPGEAGSISSYEVIFEVVEGLKYAGLSSKDIFLFERYADEFRQAGYEEFLTREMPEIQWYASAVRGGEIQYDLEGRDRQKDGERPDRDPHVVGYDRDVFRKFDYTMPQYDSNEPLSYQSHVSKIVTGDFMNKMITIPTLKDHRSAGLTIALKNMSHGLVSNVARTHAGKGKDANRCGSFIPKVVELKPIREKAVLHIMDALIAVYEGGPGSWMPSWGTWEQKSLFFATDPVAMDHVGWDILDAERASRGWAPVARMGINGNNRSGRETFYMRQPEHVELAGFLDLGIFDPSRIEHRTINIAS